MSAILACESLSCVRDGWNPSHPSRVEGVSAAFHQGGVTGVTGPDGCGKGLLLNLLGLLERPDSGRVFLDGERVDGLAPHDLREVRNQNFGFVFSQRALLPAFTVAENVAMPLFRIRGDDPAQARERTIGVLDFCGISSYSGELADRIPEEAQNLVPLARALVHGPRILVAIRPKGSPLLLECAARAARAFHLCVLWADEETHLAPFADRLVRLRDGKLLPD